MNISIVSFLGFLMICRERKRIEIAYRQNIYLRKIRVYSDNLNLCKFYSKKKLTYDGGGVRQSFSCNNMIFERKRKLVFDGGVCE